jgi:ABC-2 type transport system ATP-binding protein
MELLAVEGLSKTYKSSGQKALDNVQLSLESGMITGLLGPNGAGKSTFINIISGLLHADSGSVSWKGETLSNHQKLKERLGLVPQGIALYPKLSAFENLDFLGTQYGIAKKERHKRIEEYLNALGLYDKRKQLIQHYSGGMKRRINLIAGLLHHPELLIMDEPTVGIDVQSKQAIHQFLTELNKTGMSMLYTSHMMEEAEKICHKVAIIDHGKILVYDSPEKLIADTEGAENLEDVYIQITGKELRD